MLRGRFPGVKKCRKSAFSDSFQFRAATLQYEIQLKHYDYEKVHDSSASLAVMASSVPAFAGKDRIITVGELPAVAQQFVQTHFKAVEVSYAKVDEELFDKDYKVVFVNGSKVEFAKDGAWKEVDCKYGEVPAAIVPQQIRDYVAKNFAGRKIVSIDRDKRDWEVKLDNGLDLKFDLHFRLIEIDD